MTQKKYGSYKKYHDKLLYNARFQEKRAKKLQAESENFIENLNDSLEDEDMNNLMEIEDSLATSDIFKPVHNAVDAAFCLKHLSHYLYTIQARSPLHPSLSEDYSMSPIYNMDGVQFTTRNKNGLYMLTPIKTRLAWQTGEYPVFRAEARHLCVEKQKFKDRRRIFRRPHISSIIDPAKAQYIFYPHPENSWPIKGQFYISNMHLVFRVNKNNTLAIAFSMVLGYRIYDNAIEIIYIRGKEKLTDLFFMDSDNMKIVEVILQALG